MDVAIKVVVSFFVVLVVGGTIITISQNLLVDGRDSIDELGYLDSSDKLVEKNSFEPREILILSNSCYENNKGLLREELCYILRSTNPISISVNDIENILGYEFVDLQADISDVKTLYITYKNDNVTLSE